MAKLRCPRCNSMVPVQVGPEVVCTVCSFRGPSPGQKGAPNVAFPAAWKPGQVEAANKPQERWVLVREPSDPLPKKPLPASPAIGASTPRNIKPQKDVVVPRQALQPPPTPKSRPAPATNLGKGKTPEPKGKGHHRMPWWLYAILSVLTLGIFAIYVALKRRK